MFDSSVVTSSCHAVEPWCSASLSCTTSSTTTTSCTNPLLPVKSVPTTATCGTDAVQTAMSTKRKRKFPGPAGALPKLVTNSVIIYQTL